MNKNAEIDNLAADAQALFFNTSHVSAQSLGGETKGLVESKTAVPHPLFPFSLPYYIDHVSDVHAIETVASPMCSFSYLPFLTKLLEAAANGDADRVAIGVSRALSLTIDDPTSAVETTGNCLYLIDQGDEMSEPCYPKYVLDDDHDMETLQSRFRRHPKNDLHDVCIIDAFIEAIKFCLVHEFSIFQSMQMLLLLEDIIRAIGDISYADTAGAVASPPLQVLQRFHDKLFYLTRPHRIPAEVSRLVYKLNFGNHRSRHTQVGNDSTKQQMMNAAESGFEDSDELIKQAQDVNAKAFERLFSQLPQRVLSETGSMTTSSQTAPQLSVVGRQHQLCCEMVMEPAYFDTTSHVGRDSISHIISFFSETVFQHWHLFYFVLNCTHLNSSERNCSWEEKNQLCRPTVERHFYGTVEEVPTLLMRPLSEALPVDQWQTRKAVWDEAVAQKRDTYKKEFLVEWFSIAKRMAETIADECEKVRYDRELAISSTEAFRHVLRMLRHAIDVHVERQLMENDVSKRLDAIETRIGIISSS